MSSSVRALNQQLLSTSSLSLVFITGHEGDVLTCYLDPVGIPTIGKGFTMRSPAVRRELAKLGITKLVPGKTKITAAQSNSIFAAVLATEFEPAVRAGMPKNRKVEQHMFDAMVSAVWNLGPAFMGWRWIAPWRDTGNIASSAAIWASNYNTANKKKLRGLVRRRIEEANLFKTGNYGHTTVTKKVELQAPVREDGDVREAQTHLNKVGIPVAIDGWFGKNTSAAILKYQKMHPHLKMTASWGSRRSPNFGKMS